MTRIAIACIPLSLVHLALADGGMVQEQPVPEIAGFVGAAEAPTIGVNIVDPWSDTGHIFLRMPETLNTVHGLIFIDHYREDMPALYPALPLPSWEQGGDGKLQYQRRLGNGLTYRATATPRPGVVDLTFTLVNGSDEDTHVSTQFCLVLTHSPDFCDSRYERTWVHSDGAWVRTAEDRGPMNPSWALYHVGDHRLIEQQPDPNLWGISDMVADCGLIAIESTEGGRFVALAWENPGWLMNNAMIPCVHSDPIWPAVRVGESTTVRGRIYLHEGDLDGLLERYLADFGSSEPAE